MSSRLSVLAQPLFGGRGHEAWGADCPHCQRYWESLDDSKEREIECDECGEAFKVYYPGDPEAPAMAKIIEKKQAEARAATKYSLADVKSPPTLADLEVVLAAQKRQIEDLQREKDRLGKSIEKLDATATRLALEVGQLTYDATEYRSLLLDLFTQSRLGWLNEESWGRVRHTLAAVHAGAPLLEVIHNVNRFLETEEAKGAIEEVQEREPEFIEEMLAIKNYK